ncbi:hypothetical protein ACODT3_04270 [Streptomyces sp. 4.24]|uniref:hypothetical protein n=1 Tax=Streptomyces tritrimontium TaxID=3406573 RepID=UPI003BB76AF4
MGSSPKRERQYEHIKGSAGTAKEIAARTVDKERARAGELYAEARRRNLHGRSSMDKAALKRALGR